MGAPDHPYTAGWWHRYFARQRRLVWPPTSGGLAACGAVSTLLPIGSVKRWVSASDVLIPRERIGVPDQFRDKLVKGLFPSRHERLGS